MSATVRKIVDVPVDTLRMSLAVRYDDEDMPFDFPFRDGKSWTVHIDLATGKIRDWPGPAYSLHMKVCDEGCYTLLAGGQKVAEWFSVGAEVGDARLALKRAVPGVICEEGDDGGSPYAYIRWRSDADRIRAWAAVGAPVLAPSEDGRPSLAEWVAALTESALGMPVNIHVQRDGSVSVWAVWPSGKVKVHVLRDGGAQVRRETTTLGFIYDSEPVGNYATPAELRAALDKLGGAS